MTNTAPMKDADAFYFLGDRELVETEAFRVFLWNAI